MIYSHWFRCFYSELLLNYLVFLKISNSCFKIFKIPNRLLILFEVNRDLITFLCLGSTPCGAPVLSIHSGLPCCSTHSNLNDNRKTTGVASTESSTMNGTGSQSGAGGIGTNKSSRRKARSRSSSLGRHSRRLRNRRRAIKSTETRIHCIEASDNGMELDVETVDSPENCSPAYPTPAQLIPVAVPTAPVAAAVPPLDHEAEILEDHDLKELLNRLPDEAFQVQLVQLPT